MHAWVTNAGQNAPAAPAAPPHVHDHQGSPQKRLVYQSQPAPITTTQNNSPPQPHSQSQSRMPIINANANRAPSALASRVSTTRSQVANQLGHSRDGSVSSQRNQNFASEPLRQSQRGKPFWDGSTVDGSVFSDSASNNESRISTRHRGPVVESSLKQGAPRQHQVKRESGESRPPFTINSDGYINVVADARGPGLQRSTSTPDARSRGKPKALPRDDDSYVDDVHYQTAPARSPPNPSLNHHRAQLALRGAQQPNYSNQTPYSKGHNPMSSPPREAYRTPATGLEDDEMGDGTELLRDDEDDGPHRSTVFVDVETPIVSHPEDAEDSPSEDTEKQPTPKPAAKKSPQVNRQLFSKASKSSRGRNGLHESALPRTASDKRQSISKKRHFEPDYDDGELAAMQYDDLRKEEFDFDPVQAESQSTLLPRQGTLPDKLQHYFDKDQEAQTTFFTSMPVGDWDDAGDWFLERFGGVMNRLKEARKAKRQMVQDFENEIAEREDAVSQKIGGIERTLVDLKSEGAKLMSRTDFE